MRKSRLFEVSFLKTLLFNIRYFGLGGVKPRVLIARNFKLKSLQGVVEVDKDLKPGSIRLGFSSVSIFDKKSEIGIWDNHGLVNFGHNINLGQGVRISNHGCIEIGDNVTISANTSLICKDRIHIGKETLISWDVLIMDTDLHKIISNVDNTQTNIDKEIVIGNKVWIGCRALILKGSVISSNNVIASGSIITGSTTEENIILTTGRKILKTNIRWYK